MSTGEVKTTAARRAQSKDDKQAMRDKLLGKKLRTKEVKLYIDGDPIEFKFEAISSVELDKLRAKHKPTKEQRAEGLGVNVDTFNPALVAACLVEPELSEEDMKEIWKSEAWSSGEVGHLFEIASSLCLEGMSIPFNVSA